MNNIFKTKKKVELDSNHYLETDGFKGVCLVQQSSAKRKSKEGQEVDYIKEERFYYPNIALALNKYVDLKQVILPEVSEMLKVQEEVLKILKNFELKYKNWD